MRPSHHVIAPTLTRRWRPWDFRRCGCRPPGARAALSLGLLMAELLLVALLSPEAGEVLTRLGHSEPCELREVPARRALAALHRSRAWRRQSGLVSGEAPADMWRELCWWYVAYPARGEPGTALVFAVGVKQHRPAIRFALARPDMPALPRQARGQDDEAAEASVLRLSKSL